ALTPKIRPTSWRERPASTARTMRSRRSSEKGFAIPAGLQPSIEDEPQLDLIRESPRRFRLFGTRSSESMTFVTGRRMAGVDVNRTLWIAAADLAVGGKRSLRLEIRIAESRRIRHRAFGRRN